LEPDLGVLHNDEINPPMYNSTSMELKLSLVLD